MRAVVIPGVSVQSEWALRPHCRILTAYHEAGHAVASTVLGGSVESANAFLDEDDGLSGRVVFYTGKWRGADNVVRQLVVGGAGAAAAKRLSAGRHENVVHQDDGSVLSDLGGEADDLTQAVMLMHQLADYCEIEFSEKYVLGMLSLYTKAAERLICRHWPAVVRVAEALLERKALDGKEVVQLVWRGHGQARVVGEEEDSHRAGVLG